jgi:putative phage-type endonuclease
MVKSEAVIDREQWLIERRKRLGATDVASILELDPYRSAYEVWLDKTGQLEPWEGNEATQLGNLLEPALLTIAEGKYASGKQFETQLSVVHSSLPIAATLDGYVRDDNLPVEIKTAGMVNAFAELSQWGEAGSDQIPQNYLVQVQTQMMCCDARRAKVLALIFGRGIVEYEVERDDVVCEIIGKQCEAWWNRYVVNGEHPYPDPTPPIELLKRIKREPESVVELDEAAVELFDTWQWAKKQAKQADEAAKELQAKLLLALGNAEAGRLPSGRMVTYLETKRAGYVVQPTTYRQLRIKSEK